MLCVISAVAKSTLPLGSTTAIFARKKCVKIVNGHSATRSAWRRSQRTPMSTKLVRSVIYVRGTFGLKMGSSIALKASKISAKTASNGTNASMKW